MTKEELATVVFEECSSKTRSTKECVEAIQLRTGLDVDFSESIRRYRQSGSGLEKTVNEILGTADRRDVNLSSVEFVDLQGTPVPVAALTSGYDTYLEIFKQKLFDNPETAAKICVELDKKGVSFYLDMIEEAEHHCTYHLGIQVGDSLYFLENHNHLLNSAIECRAEGIAQNAWDIASDEVNDMETVELLEYAGFWDGVKSCEMVDNHESILIETET